MAADSKAFVAEIRAMASRLDAMPPELAQVVCTLFTLVEEQAANIDTLLAANRKLLDSIDEMKKEL